MSNNGRDIQPISLAFNQASLRLRHLTQILGYNLQLPTGEYLNHGFCLPAIKPKFVPNNGFYYTLSMSASESPEFTSEALPSCSPVWNNFDPKDVFQVQMLSHAGIVIRIWYRSDVSSSCGRCLATWGVLFSGLVPLLPDTPPQNAVENKTPTPSPSRISRRPHQTAFHLMRDLLAQNSIVFRIRGELYTAAECVLSRTLSKPGKIVLHRGVSLLMSETKKSYSVNALCKMHLQKRSIRHHNQKKENLAEEMSKLGMTQHSPVNILKAKIEDAKVRMELLTRQLERTKMETQKVCDKVSQEDSANQDLGVDLLESYRRLNRALKGLSARRARLDDLASQSTSTAAKLRRRRADLTQQLRHIFPIEAVPSPSNTDLFGICDVPLPDAESLSSASDADVSAALGLAAQLLSSVARVVVLPVRYPVEQRGSQSTISDLSSATLDDAHRAFPLHAGSGGDRDRLHLGYGVFLLNKNVAQLRWNLGLATQDLRATLPNVRNLIQAIERLNEEQQKIKSTKPRAYMADAMPRPILLPPPLSAAIVAADGVVATTEPPVDDKRHLENKLKTLTFSSSTSSESDDKEREREWRRTGSSRRRRSTMSVVKDEKDDKLADDVVRCEDEKENKKGSDCALETSDLEDMKSDFIDVLNDKQNHSDEISCSFDEKININEEVIPIVIASNCSNKPNNIESQSNIEPTEETEKDQSSERKASHSDTHSKEEKHIFDPFLGDMALRTANLANQNCSFKFSFAKQSM